MSVNLYITPVKKKKKKRGRRGDHAERKKEKGRGRNVIEDPKSPNFFPLIIDSERGKREKGKGSREREKEGREERVSS